LARDAVGQKLEPDQLDLEISNMKAMFTDLVDQVMDEKIKVLNSESVAKVMEQKIPILTKELRNGPQNPPKINSYSQIRESFLSKEPKSV
jgi:hypothetical protein